MEYDKEQLEQAWQERLAREQKYMTLLDNLRQAKENQYKKLLERNPSDFDANWAVTCAQLDIEIFDIQTSIAVKEHYLKSMEQDRIQQQAFQDAKMQFIENHSTDILKKARVCIDRKSDRATVLEGLTKDMPQRESSEWYARIWEINEHVNAAKVPNA
jgi:hypothetical protein